MGTCPDIGQPPRARPQDWVVAQECQTEIGSAHIDGGARGDISLGTPLDLWEGASGDALMVGR